MLRYVAFAIFLLIAEAAAGCTPPASDSPVSPTPSTRVTPAVYGPWPTTVTPSAGSATRPSPRAVGSPGISPTATPTRIVVSLDPYAERARRYVLSLSDLPPGFAAERIRVVTNDTAATEQTDSAAVLADYERWGRVTGFEAAYTRGGVAGVSGLAAVESVASVYRTSEGAHASIADFAERSLSDGGAPVSMPSIGDESLAYLLDQTTAQGNTQTHWAIYAIRIREGDMLISLNGYGLAGALGFDEVLALARVAVAQPRRSLPVPLPTPVPVPSATAEATREPTATPGVASLELLSYRAYRSAAGGAVFVVGVAENRGNGVAARVQVAVSLLGAQGNIIAAGSVNAAQVALVPPGGRYPIRVMLDRVPTETDWSQVRIQLVPLSAEGESPRYTSLRTDGLSLVRPQLAEDGYGLVGDVTNTGQSTARGIRVIAIAYDGQDRVLDVAVTTAKLDRLEPGGRAPFELVWSGVLTAPPYRYEVILEAQPG